MEENSSESQKTTKTVLVSHLPTSAPKSEICAHFCEIGPIKKCYLVRNENSGEFTGVAYISFTNPDDATKAVKSLNHTLFQENNILVKYSKQKEKTYDESLNTINTLKVKKEEDDQTDKKKVYLNKEERKQAKEAAKAKKGRLVIRNLNFKADKQALTDYFSKFGKLNEVTILERNGRRVGCAFIQYEGIGSAYKAIQETNLKPFMGRPISVDIAVAKDMYKKKAPPVIHLKEEEDTPQNDSIKDEDDEPMVKVEEESSDEGNSGSDDDDEDSDDDKKKPLPSPTKRLPKGGVSKDVMEGRTIFISNLSFDATDEDIKDVLAPFGNLKYVLVCIDPLTEHPRGTAFAQFIKKESADDCLSAGDDVTQQSKFVLHGRTMRLSVALSRGELQKKREEKNVEPDKDKRNLYLAREGLIREGTLASKDVSKHDLGMRQQREIHKKRLLQNLHIFISKTRLCIHNIPENLTDKQLRDIFIKHSPAGAKITENRIMRDLINKDENGVGKSKGFGFISYADHEQALGALRTMNNNPNIFSPKRRPIIEFSLENRSALKAREQRLFKSKENYGDKPKGKFFNKKNKKGNSDATAETDKTNYMGHMSNPKQKGKLGLPSHTGPKIRHKASEKKQHNKISRNQLRRTSAKMHGKKRQNSSNSSNSKPSKKRKTE